MMKKHIKFLTSALAALAFASIPALTALSTAENTITADAATYFTTTPTGYTKASDVVYKTVTDSEVGKTITANWGARGEDCTFLSSRAISFYTGNNTYEVFSQKSGGSTQSNASQSALYSTLKSFMSSKHTYTNAYKTNNILLKYTDCVSNGYNQFISSFYSGTKIGPSWSDQTPEWNKEHTWPNSKGLGGNDEHDVMMIRPTAKSENSSRGNTAYGQSSGYYDPNGEGAELRGDCARIVLYVYTRWGNTSYMWGKSGVMESLDVLLKWMQEDPVDTWEMGRNDAVQSITGTRNVFVDYPELAWLLFGRSAPTGMNTPSGIANGGEVVPPSNPGSSSDSSSGGNDSAGDTTPELPAANSTVSIADAIAIGSSMAHDTTTDNKYYLTGKVSTISNTEYGNMNIEDANGNSIYIYGTYSADGSTRFDKMNPQPKVGDTITVYSVIGNYNGAQLKNAWVTSINGSSNNDNTGDNSSNSSSSSSSGSTPNIPTDPTPDGNALAVFDFGSNGTASHNDGTAKTTDTYTNNGYTLNITNGTQLYAGARDAKGNSCLKVGSSKSIGSFNFTVANDVTSVSFMVAKYKANAATVKINGQTFNLSKASDNGEYEEITIDTTTTKTVSVATVSGGTRIMINTISFYGAAIDVPPAGDSSSSDSSMDSPSGSNSSSGNIDSSIDPTPDDSSSTGSSTDSSSNGCNHEFGAWEEVNGTQQRTCGLCGEVEELPINIDDVATGCGSTIGAYSLATLLLGGVVLFLKKKES